MIHISLACIVAVYQLLLGNYVPPTDPRSLRREPEIFMRKKQKNKSAREEHHLHTKKQRNRKETKTEKTFSPIGCAMNDKWYFVTEIVLPYCEKKLF